MRTKDFCENCAEPTKRREPGRGRTSEYVCDALACPAAAEMKRPGGFRLPPEYTGKEKTENAEADDSRRP